jgi:epoxyqueuosine reductase
VSPALTERVKAVGRALGFDRVGVAPADPGAAAERFRDWLSRGFAGEMDWLEARVAERLDPARLVPGARSVVAVAASYGARSTAGSGPISRYAQGDDYHEVIGERVRAFAEALAPLAGRAVAARGYVDTGPVLERHYAARAGLGWIGKNTCLIDPELGSWVFLGAVVTDLALEPDAPEPDHCGTCRACLDACPTDAFPEPYVLDATRCLSYTTIELRGAIPEALRAEHGEHVFGCDVCQDVCPWNTRSGRVVPPDPLGLRARLAARPHWEHASLRWLLGLGEAEWQQVTRRSAVRRARHRGLLRNALVAAGNSGDRALGPAIEAHARGTDALLAEHARWALRQLGLGEAAPPTAPGSAA